jgi:hypothetical protein
MMHERPGIPACTEQGWACSALESHACRCCHCCAVSCCGYCCCWRQLGWESHAGSSSPAGAAQSTQHSSSTATPQREQHRRSKVEHSKASRYERPGSAGQMHATFENMICVDSNGGMHQARAASHYPFLRLSPSAQQHQHAPCHCCPSTAACHLHYYCHCCQHANR